MLLMTTLTNEIALNLTIIFEKATKSDGKDDDGTLNCPKVISDNEIMQRASIKADKINA